MKSFAKKLLLYVSVAVAIDEPEGEKGETKQHQSAILEAQQQRKGREGGNDRSGEMKHRGEGKHDTKARACGANEADGDSANGRRWLVGCARVAGTGQVRGRGVEKLLQCE